MTDHISICIATYKRVQMLERLLRALARQITSSHFSISIIVVDNDETGSAKSTVALLKCKFDLDIDYSIEPIRSIAVIRNHALKLAKGNYIAIIDDDELPPAVWLLNMYNTIQTFNVDGVLGPVIPFFDEHPPAWLIKGKFCERPVLRTGTLLKWNETRTGNVLLKKAVFDEHSLQFDETFKTGGSDQAFFREAMARKYRFVACAEAPVYEIVPPARQTKNYYIKRALVNGYNSQKYARGTIKIAAPLKSAIALLLYTLICPFAVASGTHRFMQCLEKGCYHLSRLLASFGIEVLKRRNF